METTELEPGGPVYIAEVACCLDTNLGWTVSLGIAGGTNDVPVDIFMTPGLGVDSATNWPFFYLGQGYTCNTYTFTNQPDQSAFYMLGDATVDPDGDGLGTAFELLISHSDPNNQFTRGDGIDDKTAWLQGRNRGRVSAAQRGRGDALGQAGQLVRVVQQAGIGDL